MDRQDPPHIDSLPPMSAPALPRTLPPRPRSRRQTWILSVTILQGASLFSSVLIWFLLFDPVLGEYRLYGGLLAGCTFLALFSSLVVSLLLYDEIHRRKP